MNLVTVHHLPPTLTVRCISVMSDYFDGQGFMNPRTPPSSPLSLPSSSVEAFSAVHRNFRMSSRRLPVILFVSRVEFLFMILIYVARSAWCDRRRLLHCMCNITCLQSKTRSQSSAPPPPPPAASVSSPQPSPHADIVRGFILCLLQ